MKASADSYAISSCRTFAHRAIGLLPPSLRERAADRLLRREAPGPACEHVVQYLLDVARDGALGSRHHDTAVMRGADLFYGAQYRQVFNATMGAFAMTATRAFVASGGAPLGRLWWRCRKPCAAIIEEIDGAPPILVIDRETVAVPLFLPKPWGEYEREAVEAWLAGAGPMPPHFKALAEGDEIRCAEPRAKARERSADGAILDVVEALLHSRKLAILALHPQDPDAMGLHVTLFDVAVVSPRRLRADYGLEPRALARHEAAATAHRRLLSFCVGATEEVFTQCSQNLFVKRPEPHAAAQKRAHRPEAWDPRDRLERLLAHQFEAIQATVTADGLPGASPRNGTLGKVGFVARDRKGARVLIPYHPGNSVHGHAGKLWSNPYGTLVISDDHWATTRVTVSGPARVLSHAKVKRCFPAAAIASGAGCHGSSAAAAHVPKYWFMQEVAEIVQETEPLAVHRLDPVRPACSISAGGQAKHGKKPAYFAAESLPAYDRHLQHAREASGRPTCTSGSSHRDWLDQVGVALRARQAHLARVPEVAQGRRRDDFLVSGSGDASAGPDDASKRDRHVRSSDLVASRAAFRSG